MTEQLPSDTLDLHCAHDKPVYARCEQCEEDVKAGRSTGFTKKDAQPTKDTLLCARLREAAANFTAEPGDMREAAAQIDFLLEEVVRWKNAHQVAMIERDSFKGQAEVNKATVETQAEEIRKLSATVDGFLGPKFAQESAYYRSKS